MPLSIIKPAQFINATNPIKIFGRILAVVISLIAVQIAVTKFDSLIIYFFGSLVLGFIMSGFLNAAHECAHRNMFNEPEVNRFAGAMWCTPLLVNYSNFKSHHMVHHRYSGEDRDTDPPVEYFSIFQYFNAISGITHVPQAIHRVASIMLGRYPYYVKSQMEKKHVTQDNTILILWTICLLALTFIYPWDLVFLYWIPLQVAGTFIAFFALLEHYGCEVSKDLRKSTRTVSSNTVFRFYQWNANYHVEHHACPGAPADSLPRLHDQIQQQLTHIELSYIICHFKNLKIILKK